MSNEKMAALNFIKEFKNALLIQVVDDISIKAAHLATARERFEQVRTSKVDDEIKQERLNEVMRRIADMAVLLVDSEKLAALTAIIAGLEQETAENH